VAPPPAPRSGPSIGQAVVLFLAGAMLFATTCFGIFGLEQGVAPDLQPLFFVPPLLAIGLGVVVAMVAFVVGVVRAFTRTTPAGTMGDAPVVGSGDVPGPPAASTPAPPVAPVVDAGPGRPTFTQALGIAAAGCVLFLSLCAGVYNGSNGRAGWVAGPALIALLVAALYGFAVMTLRVLQSFGSGRRR
jgi:hypothetical protein